jgi:hypothetical protein
MSYAERTEAYRVAIANASKSTGRRIAIKEFVGDCQITDIDTREILRSGFKKYEGLALLQEMAD